MRTAAFVLLLLVGACIAAPWYSRLVSGSDPFRTNVLGDVAGVPVLAEAPGGLGTTPIGPGWRGAYALGADSLGRDAAARLLYGGRTSLLVAACATLLCLMVGMAAGVVAGMVGGVVDGVLSAALDLLWAFPVTLLVMSLSLVLVGAPLVLGPVRLAGDSLLLPIGILGFAYVPYVARPVRAELLGLRQAAFVEAARATGGTAWHILRHHLLPHLGPLLVGLAPIVAAMMVLTEAALSILGLGVQAPGTSWGTLIADGQGLLHQRPLLAIAPGLAVAGTVLVLSVIGDGLGRGSR